MTKNFAYSLAILYSGMMAKNEGLWFSISVLIPVLGGIWLVYYIIDKLKDWKPSAPKTINGETKEEYEARMKIKNSKKEI